MSKTFKVGDRVKCINTGEWEKPMLNEKELYEVRGRSIGNLTIK